MYKNLYELFPDRPKGCKSIEERIYIFGRLVQSVRSLPTPDSLMAILPFGSEDLENQSEQIKKYLDEIHWSVRELHDFFSGEEWIETMIWNIKTLNRKDVEKVLNDIEKLTKRLSKATRELSTLKTLEHC